MNFKLKEMKQTFMTARDKDYEIKTISLNGFWKEQSLKSYCEKRKWIPVNWHHAYVSCDGVSEVRQGNFQWTTNISSFRDHAGEMGIG